MKRMFTFLLAGSYIAIAVFGILSVRINYQTDANRHVISSNCFAANAQGVDCPKQASPIDFLNFHLGAFKNFSMATFGENILLSLVVLFAFIILGLSIRSLLESLAPPLFAVAYARNKSTESYSSSKKAFLHWLSLHENSPASF